MERQLRSKVLILLNICDGNCLHALHFALLARLHSHQLDVEESLQGEVLVVGPKPIDKHVSSALHLQRNAKLLKRLLREDDARLRVEEHGVFVAPLHLFAVDAPNEELETHLHAVAALLGVHVMACCGRGLAGRRGLSVSEGWWEFDPEALLAQLDLLLKEDVLHALVDDVEIVVFGNHHQWA